MKKFIPESIKESCYDFNSYDISPRSNYIKRNGFVVLTKRMLRQLRDDLLSYAKLELGKSDISDITILELGCGLGSFTFGLREMGFKVIAVDDYSRKSFNWLKEKWIDDIIEMDNVEALKKYGNDVDFVLMSWPEYSEPTASDSLKAMREVNDKLAMIYVGEDIEGCTADEDFFYTLNIINEKGECEDKPLRSKNFLWKTQEKFDRWNWIYDNIYLVK